MKAFPLLNHLCVVRLTRALLCLSAVPEPATARLRRVEASTIERWKAAETGGEGGQSQGTSNRVLSLMRA